MLTQFVWLAGQFLFVSDPGVALQSKVPWLCIMRSYALPDGHLNEKFFPYSLSLSFFFPPPTFMTKVYLGELYIISKTYKNICCRFCEDPVK